MTIIFSRTFFATNQSDLPIGKPPPEKELPSESAFDFGTSTAARVACCDRVRRWSFLRIAFCKEQAVTGVLKANFYSFYALHLCRTVESCGPSLLCRTNGREYISSSDSFFSLASHFYFSQDKGRAKLEVKSASRSQSMVIMRLSCNAL